MSVCVCVCVGGQVPVVILYGDTSQLPPPGSARRLYERPPPESGSDLFGFYLYRRFDHGIDLKEVLRQRDPQVIARLGRYRRGEATAEDAAYYNSKAIELMPPEERDRWERGLKPDGTRMRKTTIVETYAQAHAMRDARFRADGKPVGRIKSTSRGTHAHAEKLIAQIPYETLLAEDHPGMLSKSPCNGKLVRLGLFNGTFVREICMVYEPGTRPPAMPSAVILDVPRYTGRRWREDLPPTWLPFVVQTATDEETNTERTGYAIISAEAIPGHKMQGATIDEDEVFDHVVLYLNSESTFEQLCMHHPSFPPNPSITSSRG